MLISLTGCQHDSQHLSCRFMLTGAAWLQIYTAFFCRMNEPTYIKQLKLEILTAIADETNAYEIATELTEYVNDIDPHLARDAVRAVGRIALEVSTPAFFEVLKQMCERNIGRERMSCQDRNVQAQAHLSGPHRTIMLQLFFTAMLNLFQLR